MGKDNKKIGHVAAGVRHTQPETYDGTIRSSPNSQRVTRHTPTYFWDANAGGGRNLGKATEPPDTLSSFVCSVTEMTPVRAGTAAAGAGAAVAVLGGARRAGVGAVAVLVDGTATPTDNIATQCIDRRSSFFQIQSASTTSLSNRTESLRCKSKHAIPVTNLHKHTHQTHTRTHFRPQPNLPHIPWWH
jgi:hypothetical protein